MSEPASIRRSQEERTALSDQAMLDAAVSLIVESGAAGMTLAAIGERAGYSRGLVTHRFGSKAGLIAYVHDTVVADWIHRVQQAVGESSGLIALHRVVDALYGFIAEAPDEIRAMYLLRYSSIDPGTEFRTNVAKALKAQRRDVQGWIAAGQDAGTLDRKLNAALLAELFCASVDGLIYRWLVDPTIAIRELHELLKLQIAQTLGVTKV